MSPIKKIGAVTDQSFMTAAVPATTTVTTTTVAHAGAVEHIPTPAKPVTQTFAT